MRTRFERVAIGGVGLIGGSLALAARKAGLFGEVVGLGRTQANLDVALAAGIIDRATRDPRAAVEGADLVVLAVPVAAMATLAAAMVPALAPGAIVTDVGSVKTRILREVGAVLPAAVKFVGAHPIAGSEASGAGAARPDLFAGSICVVTPVAETDPGALAAIRALWAGVGAAVRMVAPAEHDEILAWVSHVPHVVAFALARACPLEAQEFAGPSFRDATRVAASSTEMWRDIVLYNREAVAAAVEHLGSMLDFLRDAMQRGDGDVIAAFFAEARTRRRRLPGSS